MIKRTCVYVHMFVFVYRDDREWYMKIKGLKALEVFDASGMPTITCLLTLENEEVFKATVPLDIVHNRYEAHTMRDGESRFHGKGCQRAKEIIETMIAPHLIDKVPDAIQMDLDLINLDGTPLKSSLGGNVLSAVSMCVYRAQSYIENLTLFEFISYIIGSETVSLPIPIFNVLTSTLHNDGEPKQEYLVIPGGAHRFRQAMEASLELHETLGKFLEKNNKNPSMSIEGGFSGSFSSEEALQFLQEAHQFLPLSQDFFLYGANFAASHFYDPTTRLYHIDGDVKTAAQLMDLIKYLIGEYGLYYIQDPLYQDDLASWKKLTEELAEHVLIAGADLYATNIERLAHGIEHVASNAVVVKPGQAGTVTETIQAVKVAQEAGLATIISQRGSETCDTFIADLAVGVSANFIKAGGLTQSQHVEKYNRLLEIEDYLISMS